MVGNQNQPKELAQQPEEATQFQPVTRAEKDLESKEEGLT
jgi:hypothetical protein